MSKPSTVIASGGGITPGKHHIHPAYVVMNALRGLVVISIASLSGLFSFVAAIREGEIDLDVGLVIPLSLVAVVLLVVLIVVISIMYYKRFTWELTESDIHVNSGIIFKRQVHIPFMRTQSIDFNANLIERVLGIGKLKIETAGGSLNRGVVIPALKLADAEAFRSEVFARKKWAEKSSEAAMQQKLNEARAAKQDGEYASFPAPAAGTAVAGTAAVAGAAVAGVVTTAATAVAGVAGTVDTVGAAIGDVQTPTTSQSSIDKFVDEVGSDIGGLRGIFADQYHEDAPIEYEHGLKAKELVLAAISGDHNFVVLALLIGFATQIGQIASLLGFSDFMETAVDTILQNAFAPVLIVVIVVIFIATMLLGIASSAISYGDFKARRRGGRIEVERGLLSRQYKGVAISRIQSVEIKQGFIRRLMGYGELRLQIIESMSEQQQQNGQVQIGQGLVIHPFVKIDRCDAILAQILPEFDARCQPFEYHKLPKVAFRRVVNRHTILATIPYLIFCLAVTLVFANMETFVPQQFEGWIVLVLWALLVLFVVARAIGAALWYQNAAYAYNRSMLTIRQGFYGRTTTVIPRNKIQWARIHQNPIQKMSHVANISAVTAAGFGGTTTTLRDLDSDQAIAYLDWVRPRYKLQQ